MSDEFQVIRNSLSTPTASLSHDGKTAAPVLMNFLVQNSVCFSVLTSCLAGIKALACLSYGTKC